jgi:hypothetical protein
MNIWNGGTHRWLSLRRGEQETIRKRRGEGWLKKRMPWVMLGIG